MITVLWLAGMIAGFAFPAFLIRAIRSKDDDNESPQNTVKACLAFGICVLAILVVAAYS
nr:hypothetical protein [uncultured Dysosmobacter sp.]